MIDGIETFEINIPGIPIQQGSKTARVMGGRAVLYDANAAKLKPWRATMTAAAAEALAGRTGFDGPVAVTLGFYMPLGKTVKRDRPSVTPDIDKLTRAVLDSLTVAKVWRDDSQVVDLHAHEWYSEVTGVTIRIEPA